ncbi:aldo/keto reductase [Aminobacter aminovorans]|uniref:Aldo/keto reductase n=1 Tax=Aminobacter aminovorans TaxID=83263 RepID=A0AAC8YW41_AMIAI|nr:aldo/keto reductase [Aminobacter aminovorans]AMS45515.1 Aldo/keto reductase [Aminobacter aminovorans]MBB3708590.1 aryl-alcohol dehydrogenase-like predicted oxidoreductase [Aminobacter aminovorans]
MQYKLFGKTGLLVSELGFGTMTFGDAHRSDIAGVDQAGADALLRRALDAGVNLIDTADMYSSGQSEVITGQSLRNLGVRREDVIVATKAFGPVGGGPNDRGSSRGHILDAAAASLNRLQLDHIDLYQLQGFDPLTPMEESLGALDHLVRSGMVRYVGVSNWAAWQIATGMGVISQRQLTPISSVQAYYSLAGRDLDHEIVPFLQSSGLGLIVWSPLAGGLLSGKFSRSHQTENGSRRSGGAFPPVNVDKAWDLIDLLGNIAGERSVSVAQVALLAWLLHQPSVTSVLLGAKRVDQLDDNLKAADLVLTTAEIELLDRASAPEPTYPRWMNQIFDAGRGQQSLDMQRRMR